MPSLAAIVQRYCAQQADVLDAALQGIATSDEAVHDARVACRRLATALRLAEDCFGTARAETLRQRVQDVLRLLGAIRDAEVLVQHVAGFSASVAPPSTAGRTGAAPVPQPGLGSLRFLQTALDRKKARILRVLKRRRYATLPRDLRSCGTACQAVNHEQAARVTLGQRLEKLETWRRRGDSPERLHRLRIQFKKLRYAAEFYALFEPDLRRLADFARRFQNVLGDYHDAVVLEQELQSAARDHDDKLLRAALKSARTDQRALKARFRKLWSRKRIKRWRRQGLSAED